jgi:SAM-dependent methyltransferase
VNWKLKAAIQQAIGALPDAVSYPAYYAVQRTIGGLRHPDPIYHVRGAIAMLRRIRAQGRSLGGARFLEIGTGRQLNVPIALWLCGAGRTVTIDLNRYLKPALVFENIDYMRRHGDAMTALFADAPEDQGLFADRFRRLVSAPRDLPALMRLLDVQYEAPADATSIPIAAGTIDFHTSFTVLEHVPPGIIERIFAEGRRVLAPGGRFVHYIDFSDHGSHADPAITAVNFLQFPEGQWARWAANRYAYHNRLRVDEFSDLVTRAGARVLSLEPTVDARSVDALAGGLPLDPRFAAKTPQTNATIDAWLVAAP